MNTHNYTDVVCICISIITYLSHSTSIPTVNQLAEGNQSITNIVDGSSHWISNFSFQITSEITIYYITIYLKSLKNLSQNPMKSWNLHVQPESNQVGSITKKIHQNNPAVRSHPGAGHIPPAPWPCPSPRYMAFGSTGWTCRWRTTDAEIEWFIYIYIIYT